MGTSRWQIGKLVQVSDFWPLGPLVFIFNFNRLQYTLKAYSVS